MMTFSYAICFFLHMLKWRTLEDVSTFEVFLKKDTKV